jgi:hypothetical protein
MKIYIDHPDLDETGITARDSFNSRCVSIKFILLKYQLMWVLRKLEEELRISNGFILIDENGTPHCKNFEQDLLDKISHAFSEEGQKHYGVEL